MKKINPEHIKIAMEYCDKVPFHQLAGIKMTSLSEGGARIEMEIRDDLRNIRGGLHRGIFAAMLDICTGWALYCSLDEGESMVTANLTVHDLAATDCTADIIHAVGYVVRRGHNIAICEGRVEAPDGRLLAMGTSTMMIVEGPGTLAALTNEKMPPKFIEVPDEPDKN